MPIRTPTKATVILIPGIYENAAFMRPIITYLRSAGYDVHTIARLGYNRGSVERMTDVVSAYIDDHKLIGVYVVAHSKGGLIAKLLLMRRPDDIKRVIVINTPFNGSRYARLFLLRQIRVFIVRSPLLTMLAHDTAVNRRIISLYSTFDPHIPGGSYLDGATNIQFDAIGHFRPLSDNRVHRLISENL